MDTSLLKNQVVLGGVMIDIISREFGTPSRTYYNGRLKTMGGEYFIDLSKEQASQIERGSAVELSGELHQQKGTMKFRVLGVKALANAAK